jgi:hypothetical protein
VGGYDLWSEKCRRHIPASKNLIFHDLLGVLFEVYIDDIVVKSARFEEHLANLHMAFHNMKRYGLKMNPLKCAFRVLAGRFMGFIVHENGIQVNPKKVESIKKLVELTRKKDVQKLLGKVNYMRRFISKLAGKLEMFLPLVQLKHDSEFTWGQIKEKLLRGLRNMYPMHWFSGSPVLSGRA